MTEDDANKHAAVPDWQYFTEPSDRGEASWKAESKRLLRSVLEDPCCDLPPPGGTCPEWLDWPEGFRVLREAVRWTDARRGLLNKDVAMEGPLLHELADIADFILGNRARQRHVVDTSDIRVELAAAGLSVDVNLTDRVAWELNRLDWENKNKERHKDDVIYRLALLLFCFHKVIEYDQFRDQLLTDSTPCINLTWELLRAVCRLRMISRRLLVPNPTLVGGYARARRKVTQVPQDTFTLEFLYIAQQFCLAVLWKALQVPAVKHAHLERLLFKGFLNDVLMTATESPSEGVRIAAFHVMALLLQGAPHDLDNVVAEAQPRYLRKEDSEYAGARAAHVLFMLGAAEKLVQALVCATLVRPVRLNVREFFGNLEKPDHVESWIPFRMSAGSHFRTLGPDRALPPPPSMVRRRLYLPAPAAATSPTSRLNPSSAAKPETRDSGTSTSNASASRPSKAEDSRKSLPAEAQGASAGEGPALRAPGSFPGGARGSEGTSRTGPGASSPADVNAQCHDTGSGDKGRIVRQDSSTPQAASSAPAGASAAASSQAGAAAPPLSAALHALATSGNASPADNNGVGQRAPPLLVSRLAEKLLLLEAGEKPDSDAVDEDGVEHVDANPPSPPPAPNPPVAADASSRVSGYSDYALQVMGLEKPGFKNNWERYGTSYETDKVCAFESVATGGGRFPWNERVIACSVCIPGYRNRTKVVAHIMALALGVEPYTSVTPAFNWHAVSIILRCMTLLATHFPTAFADVFQRGWAKPSDFVRLEKYKDEGEVKRSNQDEAVVSLIEMADHRTTPALATAVVHPCRFDSLWLVFQKLVFKLMEGTEVENWYIQGDAFFLDLHNFISALTCGSGALAIPPDLGNIDVPAHLRLVDWLANGILAARHPLLEQACKQELSFVLTYDVEGLLIGGITTQLWLMVDAVMAIGNSPLTRSDAVMDVLIKLLENLDRVYGFMERTDSSLPDNSDVKQELRQGIYSQLLFRMETSRPISPPLVRLLTCMLRIFPDFTEQERKDFKRAARLLLAQAPWPALDSGDFGGVSTLDFVGLIVRLTSPPAQDKSVKEVVECQAAAEVAEFEGKDEFLSRVVKVIAGYPGIGPGSPSAACGNSSQAAPHPSSDSKLPVAASDADALDPARAESKAAGSASQVWDPEDPTFWEETDPSSEGGLGLFGKRDSELLEFVHTAYVEASVSNLQADFKDDLPKVSLREMVDEIQDYMSHKKKPKPSISNPILVSVIDWTQSYVRHAPCDDVVPCWGALMEAVRHRILHDHAHPQKGRNGSAYGGWNALLTLYQYLLHFQQENGLATVPVDRMDGDAAISIFLRLSPMSAEASLDPEKWRVFPAERYSAMSCAAIYCVHTLLCISQGAELEQEQELRLLYGLSCCLEALTMYYSVESVSPLSKPSGPNDGRTDVMASTRIVASMVRMTLSAVVRREAVPLPAKNLVRQLWDLSLQCEGRLGEEVSVTLHPFKLVSVEKPLRSVARSLRLLVEPDAFSAEEQKKIREENAKVAEEDEFLEAQLEREARQKKAKKEEDKAAKRRAEREEAERRAEEARLAAAKRQQERERQAEKEREKEAAEEALENLRRAKEEEQRRQRAEKAERLEKAKQERAERAEKQRQEQRERQERAKQEKERRLAKEKAEKEERAAKEKAEKEAQAKEQLQQKELQKKRAAEKAEQRRREKEEREATARKEDELRAAKDAALRKMQELQLANEKEDAERDEAAESRVGSAKRRLQVSELRIWSDRDASRLPRPSETGSATLETERPVHGSSAEPAQPDAHTADVGSETSDPAIDVGRRRSQEGSGATTFFPAALQQGLKREGPLLEGEHTVAKPPVVSAPVLDREEEEDWLFHVAPSKKEEHEQQQMPRVGVVESQIAEPVSRPVTGHQVGRQVAPPPGFMSPPVTVQQSFRIPSIAPSSLFPSHGLPPRAPAVAPDPQEPQRPHAPARDAAAPTLRLPGPQAAPSGTFQTLTGVQMIPGYVGPGSAQVSPRAVPPASSALPAGGLDRPQAPSTGILELTRPPLPPAVQRKLVGMPPPGFSREPTAKPAGLLPFATPQKPQPEPRPVAPAPTSRPYLPSLYFPAEATTAPPLMPPLGTPRPQGSPPAATPPARESLPSAPPQARKPPVEPLQIFLPRPAPAQLGRGLPAVQPDPLRSSASLSTVGEPSAPPLRPPLGPPSTRVFQAATPPLSRSSSFGEGPVAAAVEPARSRSRPTSPEADDSFSTRMPPVTQPFVGMPGFQHAFSFAQPPPARSTPALSVAPPAAARVSVPAVVPPTSSVAPPAARVSVPAVAPPTPLSEEPSSFFNDVVHLRCPLSKNPLDDPVVAADGNTYSRTAIADWFSKGHRISPIDGAPLASVHLIENVVLRNFLNMALLER